MRAEILVGPERRRRWTAEQKLRVVREAFEGGARVAEVAPRREVSRAQIYQWRTKLGDGRSGRGGQVPLEDLARARGATRPAAVAGPAAPLGFGQVAVEAV